MKKKKKINTLIVAGETSGDILGGALMRELSKDPSYDFTFWGTGGDEMIKEKLTPLMHIRDLEAIGLEILLKARFFFSLIKRISRLANNEIVDKAKPDIKTDLAILIDYPGFNLRLAKKLKKNNIPVIYYVAPQVWAWHYSRVKEMKKNISLILLLFQFEKKIFDKEKIPSVFIGHPIAANLDQRLKDSKILPKAGNAPPPQKTITLMPGSRTKEITSLLPLFGEIARNLRKTYPHCRFLLPYNNKLMEDYILNQCKIFQLEPYYDLSLRSIKESDLVLLASGTATLEVALLKKPMLIAYKVGFVTYHVFKRILNIAHIGLVNIISGKTIVPEFIQHDASVEKMLPAALALLDLESKERKKMINELAKIERLFRMKDPSKESYKAIISFLNKSKKR